MDQASTNPLNGLKAGPAGTLAAEGAPSLDLDGFSGPLDLLLALARAQRIDLSRIPLSDLLHQLAPALRQAAPLAERGGWLVMAAWLVLLRSRLLLPEPAPSSDGTAQGRAAQGRTGRQARRLHRQLLGLERVQALAAWLDQQPQLGRDVFGRGTPGDAAPAHGVAPEVDVVEFLWACTELLDSGNGGAGTAAAYAPPRPALHSVSDARARILKLLGDGPEPQPLGRLLPNAAEALAAPTAASTAHAALLRRSGWASAFAASLELAKQGTVTLAQNGSFAPILVHAAQGRPSVGA